MAVIAKLSTGIRPADIPERQLTVQLAEACAQGDVVRLDATNGTFTGANGSSTAEADGPLYILLEGGIAGEYRTGVQRGKIAGFDLSGVAHGASVFLSNTDKSLDTAAGTVSTVVGQVISGTANAAQPHDKILEVG
jgi:hypothetical protein